MKPLAWAAIAVATYALLIGGGRAERPPAHMMTIPDEGWKAEVLGGKVTRIPTTWSAEPQGIRPSNPGEYAENRAKQVWQQKRWLGEVTMGGHTYRLIEPKENACLVAAHALADALRVEDWNCRSVVRS